MHIEAVTESLGDRTGRRISNDMVALLEKPNKALSYNTAAARIYGTDKYPACVNGNYDWANLFGRKRVSNDDDDDDDDDDGVRRRMPAVAVVVVPTLLCWRRQWWRRRWRRRVTVTTGTGDWNAAAILVTTPGAAGVDAKTRRRRRSHNGDAIDDMILCFSR